MAKDPHANMEDDIVADYSAGTSSEPGTQAYGIAPPVRLGRLDEPDVGDPDLSDVLPVEGVQPIDHGGDDGSPDEEKLSLDNPVESEGSDTRTPWSLVGDSGGPKDACCCFST